MVIVAAIIGIALIGAGVLLLGPILFPGRIGRVSNAEWEAGRKAARFRRQVDGLFAEARIRMEEAAGWRQPGERRIGDDMRGSWHRW